MRPKIDYLFFQEQGRAKAKEKSLLHLAGCMLYWAEGGKTGRTCRFINSDPYMLLMFLRFLRQEMNIKIPDIRIYIFCHEECPERIKVIEQYWSKLLQIPLSQFAKTRIKHGNRAVKHKIYENGFCTIYVRKQGLTDHMLGAIQEYTGLDNYKWLQRGNQSQ
jgi:hypothetical protein